MNSAPALLNTPSGQIITSLEHAGWVMTQTLQQLIGMDKFTVYLACILPMAASYPLLEQTNPTLTTAAGNPDGRLYH